MGLFAGPLHIKAPYKFLHECEYSCSLGDGYACYVCVIGLCLTLIDPPVHALVISSLTWCAPPFFLGDFFALRLRSPLVICLSQRCIFAIFLFFSSPLNAEC